MADPSPFSKGSESTPNQVEKEMRFIESLVLEAKDFEVNNPPNEEVRQVMAIVEAELLKHKDVFLSQGILVAYHGSLQYRDPKNLDLDVTFTTDRESGIKKFLPLIFKIESEFNHLTAWPQSKKNENHYYTNFSYDSIEDIKNEVAVFERRPRGEDDFSGLVASCIITSKVLFPEQEKLAEDFRKGVRTILRSSAVLRQAVIEVLERLISTRKERQLKK